jgi:hypothetical protein
MMDSQPVYDGYIFHPPAAARTFRDDGESLRRLKENETAEKRINFSVLNKFSGFSDSKRTDTTLYLPSSIYYPLFSLLIGNHSPRNGV